MSGSLLFAQAARLPPDISYALPVRHTAHAGLSISAQKPDSSTVLEIRLLDQAAAMGQAHLPANHAATHN